MYCRGGNSTTSDDQNTNLAVNPLYNLTKENWWFQHHRGCDVAPPKTAEFLELPANGEFTVELAHNRAFTTLSYDGKFVTDWPDGKEHPEDWNGYNTDGTPAVCLKEDGALHTYNESSAGGTAFAISYHSELKDVTMENLVVFTTLYHTPWKRLATYKVPDLQACPEGGCTCAWLWVPNGCGEANMYMQGFKCNVTNASPTAKPLAPAQVATYCEDDASKCVKGAKQMLAWHQLTGNNIETEQWVTPNYNQKCGWAEGAQTDIFEQAAQPTTSSNTAVVSSTSSAFSYTSPSAVVSSSTTSSVAMSYTSVAPASASSNPASSSKPTTTLATLASSTSVTVKEVPTTSAAGGCSSAPVLTVTAPAVTVTVTKYHSRKPSARAAA
ncbi:hypothetical protein BDV96DRAFT_486657 [Lophiotrema nucula]|uniref:Proteophosphoglycan ppg4 n=1 Tax=Lophiotrema nucula TaxID=690887 RepID=A0A6A5ZKD6_9PLEO|nr:hypothetical protein BDV96DRAFT_486657 [Lophiotrema nucula]